MPNFLTTEVFSKNIQEYNSGMSLIINKGGTRSSKTYSILQLLFLIAISSKKPLIISVVSYALPHLKLGAMRELENIIRSYGMLPESLKNISDSYYKINNSIIEFFGVDNLGKVHGPERDILYINECNYIKSYDIVRQLLVRTRKTTFMDYNPAREFWINDEIIGKRDCAIIKSTYKDNNYLSPQQVKEIELNRHNAMWWRVYGEGEDGRLEGCIIQNWTFGEFDTTLPYGYGFDFGSKHPDALLKCAVDHKNKKIYWKEEIYQNNLSTAQLIELLKTRNVGKSLIIGDSAAPRTIQDIRGHGYNIRAVEKGKIIDDIKMLWEYQIIVDPESYNLQKNLNNWVWLDKKGEVPSDVDDDLIDAGRYISRTFILPARVQKNYHIPKS